MTLRKVISVRLYIRFYQLEHDDSNDIKKGYISIPLYIVRYMLKHDCSDDIKNRNETVCLYIPSNQART